MITTKRQRSALARAAAKILYDSQIIDLDPIAPDDDDPEKPPTPLQKIPHLTPQKISLDSLDRLTNLAIDQLGGKLPQAASPHDTLLAHAFHYKTPIPPPDQTILVTWESQTLQNRQGFAILQSEQDRPNPHILTLTTWHDILTVMQLNGADRQTLLKLVQCLRAPDLHIDALPYFQFG